MLNQMRYFSLAAVLALAFLLAVPSSGEAQQPDYDRGGIQIGQMDDITFSMGFRSVGRFQALSQDDVFVWDGSAFVEPSKPSTGMQTSFANIEFLLSLGDDIDVFFDLLVATQRHPTRTWGHQGYMYIRQMPAGSPLEFLNPIFEKVDMKAGNFYANFGEHQFTRSLNGDTRRNPLAGNPVVYALGVEPGMELYFGGDGMGAMVGGGIGAPEQDFVEARGYSYRAKLWFDRLDGIYLSGSYYNVSHDEGVVRGTNLFRRARLGSPYAAIWNLHNDDGGGGEGPGTVRPGDGRDVSAWELNAIATLFPGNHLAAFYGQAEGSGLNPALPGTAKGTEEWSYYSIEATQFLGDLPVYLSGRYSAIDYDRLLTTDNAGKVDRFQIGGGLFITDQILMKAEFVTQSASGFQAETVGVANWVDVGRSPSFSGLILEVGMSF